MTPRHLLEPGRLAGAALLKAQSDGRLVDMTRAGNDRAFEAIVDRYKAALLRYCSRILPDGRGEDAVQQTFLKAYDAIHRDTTPLSLRSWLFGIAHNVALNILRQRATDGTSAVPDSPVRALGTESAHDSLERRERFREVLAAVAALPPGQRDALLLRELEGRGHEEIARELGITGGAARQLISRARNGIRTAAAAAVPLPLVMRLSDSGAAPVTAERVAELSAVGAGITATKLVATAAVSGTLLGGAMAGTELVEGDRDRRDADVAEAAPSSDRGLRDSQPGAQALSDDRSRSDSRDDEDGSRRGDDDDAAEDDDDRSGRRDGDDDDYEDRSGPGDGDHAGDDPDDSSGPGPGGDDEDRSGPGPGETADDDHSGPGSGETTDDVVEEDNSGSGSSGSGGTPDLVEPDTDVLEADGDNSGPGGGED